MSTVIEQPQALSPWDYELATFSQSACNLCGLVHGFSRVMHRIFAEAKAKGKGTAWINEHPICRLYAEQIMHLTQKRDWNEAYNICEANSKEITREVE